MNVKTSQNHTFAAMSLITIALLAATICLIPNDPVLMYRIQSYFRPYQRVDRQSEKQLQDEKMGPSLGIVMPEVGAGNEIKNCVRPSAKGIFVVYLGDCASCIRFDMAKWATDATKNGIPIVAFTDADEKRMKEFSHNLPHEMPLYLDTKRELMGALNAFFAGRVYFFDRAWRLQWAESVVDNGRTINQLPKLVSAIKMVSQ